MQCQGDYDDNDGDDGDDDNDDNGGDDVNGGDGDNHDNDGDGDEDGDDNADNEVKTMHDLINSVRMCPLSPTVSGDVKDMIMTHPLLICYIVIALITQCRLIELGKKRVATIMMITYMEKV